MSMYNMLFGANPSSDVLLATLGLSRGSVGRFRDCHVSAGEIAVYTRNGGGNRECVCHDDPAYGGSTCENEPYQKTVDEYVRKAGGIKECGCKAFIAYGSLGGIEHDHPTGNQVEETLHRCLFPDSEKCGCYGCIITYRLPKHPNYLRDEDDEFDNTYATIYFSFPEEFAEGLRMHETGQEWNPDERWAAMLSRIEAAS